MRDSMKLEIERSLQKLSNQKKQVDEIQRKLLLLEGQLQNLNKGIENEVIRFEELGQKTPRRDGRPETPQEYQKKLDFNTKLRLEKLGLVQEILKEKKVYEAVEKLLPEAYRDKNL